MKQLIHIIQSLLSHPDDCIFFDEPMIVRNEYVSLFECWGLAVRDSVWLMDEKGDWYELGEDDEKFDVVLTSIYERLKLEGVKAA